LQSNNRFVSALAHAGRQALDIHDRMLAGKSERRIARAISIGKGHREEKWRERDRLPFDGQ
jgi:hypothetical protein